MCIWLYLPKEGLNELEPVLKLLKVEFFASSPAACVSKRVG